MPVKQNGNKKFQGHASWEHTLLKKIQEGTQVVLLTIEASRIAETMTAYKMVVNFTG